MPNIFFFDIDNTLLDHGTQEIPPSALQAIAQLHTAGHTVVVATGRSYAHAKPFIELVQADYAITQNGARILKGEEEVLTIPLAQEPLKALFDWMHAQGHHYGFNDGSQAHISAAAPPVLNALGSVTLGFQCGIGIRSEQNIYQAWLFFDEALDDSLNAQIEERFPEFDLVRWHRTAVDVLPKAINKWTGCQWVMEQTGFAPHQAIAFGDGLNDIEMLQGVGLGIAMDNGHPELKAIAHRIAPALHLDGIAAMLEELASNRNQP